MKSKTIKKVIIIAMLTLLIAIVIMPKSFAGIAPSDISGNISGDTTLDTSFIEKLVNVLRFLGIFLAVGVMMIIGIKYMTGSIEEKANYKKSMMPYLIGCFFLFRIRNNSTTNIGTIQRYKRCNKHWEWNTGYN